MIPRPRWKQPRVELLWWRGCPSTETALETLRDTMGELGLDGDAVEVREVATDAEAARERFVGSPTIRIDGEDIQPPDAGEPTVLACRVYRLADGRISPVPDRDQLQEALVAALERSRDEP